MPQASERAWSRFGRARDDLASPPRDKHIMPWRIEDEMKKIGANYVHAGRWRGFAVRDGNLVTGQQTSRAKRPRD